jgi:hypothetical protein
VLKKTFGPKRKKVAGGWKKLNKEESHNFYVACGYVASMGEKKYACRILIQKPNAQNTAFKNGVYE